MVIQRIHPLSFLLLCIGALSMGACALELEYENGFENGCEDGYCDDFQPPPRMGQCELADLSGRTQNINIEINSFLNDAFAVHVGQMSTCPLSYRELIGGLRDQGCSEPKTWPTESSAQHVQKFVADLSPENELRKVADTFGGQIPEMEGYRTITVVECSAQKRIYVLQDRQFATAPLVRNKQTGLAEPVFVDERAAWEPNGLRKPYEVIAFDPEGGPILNGKPQGLYNYYSVEPTDKRHGPCAQFGPCAESQLFFHGNSIQYLDRSEEMHLTAQFDPQSSVHDTDRACGACHVGGGLIARERDWFNWPEENTNDHVLRQLGPGIERLMDAHSDVFGHNNFKTAALELADMIKEDEQAWSTTKNNLSISEQPENQFNVTLRETFCGSDIQLANDPAPRADFFFDPEVIKRLSSNFSNFEDSLASLDLHTNEQIIPRLTHGSDLNDPVFPNVPAFGINQVADGFIYPTARTRKRRNISSGGDHSGYGTTNPHIPAPVHLAALTVDLGRPLFSDERCDLYRTLAPDLQGVSTRRLSVALFQILNTKLQNDTLSESGKVFFEGLLIAGAIEFEVGDDVFIVAKNRLLGEGIAPQSPLDRVQTFLGACNQRAINESEDFASDLLMVANARRERAYEEPIMKFRASSMPTGKFFKVGTQNTSSSGHSPKAWFNPVDCSLEIDPSDSI